MFQMFRGWFNFQVKRMVMNQRHSQIPQFLQARWVCIDIINKATEWQVQFCYNFQWKLKKEIYWEGFSRADSCSYQDKKRWLSLMWKIIIRCYNDSTYAFLLILTSTHRLLCSFKYLLGFVMAHEYLSFLLLWIFTIKKPICKKRSWSFVILFLTLSRFSKV